MKKIKYLAALFCISLFAIFAAAQKVTISGQAKVGMPKNGDTLLAFNTERPWVFRQYDVGPSTALELHSTVGLKNFLITTTGNVGIDVVNPVEKLQVNGSIIANGPRIGFGSAEYIEDGGSFIISCNGTFQSTLDNTDLLGSSAKRWNALWAVNGTINTSDIKYKTNIRTMPYGLSQIMQLRPVLFDWIGKPEDGSKIGLIAQDVQQVISEVVVDHEYIRSEQTGEFTKVPVKNLGMYYADLIPVLIKGMQEQQAMIQEKDTRIASLENKMAEMQLQLNTLQQFLLRVTPATVLK